MNRLVGVAEDNMGRRVQPGGCEVWSEVETLARREEETAIPCDPLCGIAQSWPWAAIKDEIERLERRAVAQPLPIAWTPSRDAFVTTRGVLLGVLAGLSHEAQARTESEASDGDHT